MQNRILFFLAIKLPTLPILLIIACNGAWAASNRDYIQGGVDVVAASDERKPVLGWELSFWRLENLPTDTFGPLTGHGYTIGFENKETASLIYVQYNRIGYAYHEKAGKLPFPMSQEYKAFLDGKPVYNISFFHRIGLPVSWWIFPIH